MVGFNLYSASPWSVWRSFDTPLYRIKKNNLKKINALPPCAESPMKKYTHATTTQIVCVYFLAAASGAIIGAALGAFIVLFSNTCKEKKS